MIYTSELPGDHSASDRRISGYGRALSMDYDRPSSVLRLNDGKSSNSEQYTMSTLAADTSETLPEHHIPDLPLNDPEHVESKRERRGERVW